MFSWWFFLYSSESGLWHFIQIVVWGNNLHELSKPIFWVNIRKMFQNVVCFCVCYFLPSMQSFNRRIKLLHAQTQLGLNWHPNFIERNLTIQSKKYYKFVSSKDCDIFYLFVSYWFATVQENESNQLLFPRHIMRAVPRKNLPPEVLVLRTPRSSNGHAIRLAF